ncbi:hypothetical protein BH24PSE2_BH24PSE2_11650 [soil metagenome]
MEGKIDRLQRIEDIDAAAWNRLAPDDVYAQHGWLRVVEVSVCEAVEPVYFLLREGGELLGAAICYVLRTRGSSLDEMWFGRLHRPFARIGLSLSPALYCGPMIGQGRHMLWRRDTADPGFVVDRLLDAMTAFAETERLALAVAKLPADQQSLLDALNARRFIRTMNWPVSYLEIRWENLDAYVSALPGSSSRMRTTVRREIAAPGKAGIRFTRPERFSTLSQELFDLVEANHRAHSEQPLGLAPDFFRTLERHHAGASIVTLACSDDGVTGVALLLTAGRCAGGPLIGVSDDARNRKAFTYFNLAFYEPIRICIERGLEGIWLGAGLYDMKRRRGCRERELVMLVRPRSTLGRAAARLWTAAHRRWVHRKLARDGVARPR